MNADIPDKTRLLTQEKLAQLVLIIQWGDASTCTLPYSASPMYQCACQSQALAPVH